VLAAQDAASYLLRRRLIEAEAVVDGRFVCHELARRHRSFSVTCGTAPGYLLKQAYLPERAAAVRREAVVYEALWRESAGSAVAAVLPRFFGYDRDEGVLVLELVAGGRTLREHYTRTGRFSKLLARRLGCALAAVHGFAPVKDPGLAAGEPPWALAAHQPDLSFLRDLSEASVKVVRVLHGSDELCGRLDELRCEWRATGLAHNDMRWDNCVVSTPPGSRRTTRLKLVDWELAGWGDPCWDLGSAFAEFLALWLLSIPVADATSPTGWVELARHPIERMQPAIRSLWWSYERARALPATGRGTWLTLATRYAAARLIQTAIEQGQLSPRPTAFVVLALQLALNLLSQPERGAAQLLGLPFAVRST
jgi:aminoglycoside phosphotransferase (APT) family kinase protein